MKNYYQVLGVEPRSSVSQIKQAYRLLAKKYHPDVNNSPDAAEKFIEINEAYDMLIYKASLRVKHLSPENTEEYEELFRKFREEAKRRARIKYEKYQREYVEFRESGLYDLVLILKYIGTILLPVIATALVLFPLYITIVYKEPYAVFYLIFFSIFGGIIWLDIFQRRKTYFKKGKFYFTWTKLKAHISGENPLATGNCFFCKGIPAQAKSFAINIIHIKSIHLQNRGPLQHNVGYNRTEEKIYLPRSNKAYRVHLLATIIKIVTIIWVMVFSDIKSYAWRFILGLFAAWILSVSFLWIMRTKSKVGYLFSYAMFIKTTIWLLLISIMSHFEFHPFNIYTSEYLPVTIIFYLFLDAVLEQLLKMSKYNLYKPLTKPYCSEGIHFVGNNHLYLEIPFWTTIYPIIRWIF